MSVVLQFPPRWPTAIMCDLATVKARIAEYDRLADFTDEQDRAFSVLEDRRTALEEEAKAAIYAATGVSWELWEGALS